MQFKLWLNEMAAGAITPFRYTPDPEQIQRVLARDNGQYGAFPTYELPNKKMLPPREKPKPKYRSKYNLDN